MENKFEDNYFTIKKEYLLDAKIYLSVPGEMGIEWISALCDISYEEAKVLIENYREECYKEKENNLNPYLVTVASLMQKKWKMKN